MYLPSSACCPRKGLSYFKTDLQLSAGGLSKYVWPFGRHQAVKGFTPFSSLRLVNINLSFFSPMLLALLCGNEDAMATLCIPLLVSDLLVPWLLHNNEKITVKLLCVFITTHCYCYQIIKLNQNFCFHTTLWYLKNVLWSS